MKASVSALPKSAYVLAAVYFAAHLPFLAPSLEDYDSINFALGLRDFDPSRHQPHPPGSPVYIALGRVAFAAVNAIHPGATRSATEAWALAMMSAIAGAAAIIAFASVLVSVVAPERRAPIPWAVALFAACPLMWIAGSRPMSDVVGLAAALGGQALLLHGRTRERLLWAGALVAGLAAGIRVQTMWLTVPLLAFVVFTRGSYVRPIAAVAAGGLAWAVPLVADSGGGASYLRALGSQAGEDFAWVNMLWLEPTPRRLAFVLYETFVLPWGSVILAGCVAAACVAGLALAAVRQRAALAMLLLAFAPYAVFHMLFQETITVRYALPTLPFVAWLAANAVAASPRWTPAVAAPLIAGALFIAIPDGLAYARAPHPVFQALADAAIDTTSRRPDAVFAHHSVWRAIEAEAPQLPAIPPPRLYEWLGPAEYWRTGGRGFVWFFADPRRTDLALIDPQARMDVVRYRWAVEQRPEFSGVRPAGADWYRIAPPGWFATEGWSLTPETGGLASVTARGPDHRPIEAWVRRQRAPLRLVVGGRHLGDGADPPAEFELGIDGSTRDRWRLSVGDRNFLRFLDLPDGLPGTDDYALLTIAARAIGAGRTPAVAVRQFDIQPATRMIYGFGEGWHEEEYEPATGLRWRWSSGRSLVRIKGATSDIGLTLRGESPLRYFDAPPDVQVTAGGRVIARLQPADDFEWTVRVPAADVTRGGGVIAIETVPVYRPGEREGTTDQRELGLRLFECRVYPLPH